MLHELSFPSKVNSIRPDSLAGVFHAISVSGSLNLSSPLNIQNYARYIVDWMAFVVTQASITTVDVGTLHFENVTEP